MNTALAPTFRQRFEATLRRENVAPVRESQPRPATDAELAEFCREVVYPMLLEESAFIDRFGQDSTCSYDEGFGRDFAERYRKWARAREIR